MSYGTLQLKVRLLKLKPYDINDIKHGINKIISDSNYREKIINRGFTNIKRFHLDTIPNQYLELYKSLDKNN